MLHHHALHAVGETRLYDDWDEALHLWELLVQAAAGLTSACLMSNHAHVTHAQDLTTPLRNAMSAYARWRNHRHGWSGPAWDPLSVSTIEGGDKERRQVRYVHRNPVPGIVRCPLGWPLSTHIDAVGLALRPVVRRSRDPEAFHRYVSAGDGTPEGTPFPACGGQVPSLDDVAAAYSHLARVPLAALRRKGPARLEFVRLARALCDAPIGRVADWVGVCRRRVSAAGVDVSPEQRRRVEQVLFDPRFQGLHAGDPILRWRPRGGA